jgi:hypothetical protein
LALEPLGDFYWEAYEPKKHQQMQKAFISRIKKACPGQWQSEGWGELYTIHLKYTFTDLTKPPEDIEIFQQNGSCCEKCIPIAEDVIREYAKPTIPGVTTYRTQLLYKRNPNVLETLLFLYYFPKLWAD